MSRRTGVALLITELNPGGAERALTHLARGLNGSEFDVEFYCLAPRPAAAHAELAQALESSGIPLHFLGATSTWQAPQVAAALSRSLRRQRPRALLSFLYHANVVGGLVAMAAGRPLVHIPAVRVAEPNRWRLRLEAPFLRRCRHITCVSESLAEYVARHQDVGRGRIVVIPNGIEVEPFAAALPADLTPLGIGPERRLLTAIGRLAPQKGFDWLLSEIDALLGRLPEHDLLLVGDGPQHGELDRLRQASSNRGRIHLIGRRSDIPAILRRSEVLLLPSRYEGMPNVVLEAMAAGLPIAATGAEGVAELLGPSAAPQCTAVGDTTAYHEMVCRLAADSDQRARLGAANQTRVRECYSLRRLIDSYAELLRSASTEPPGIS